MVVLVGRLSSNSVAAIGSSWLGLPSKIAWPRFFWVVTFFTFQLWALLHFIMPTLFDSHQEFNEWFSKDIESHAMSESALNERNPFPSATPHFLRSTQSTPFDPETLHASQGEKRCGRWDRRKGAPFIIHPLLSSRSRSKFLVN